MNTEAGGGTAYQAGDNITVNSDVTLYAHDAASDLHKLQLNGGTVNLDDITSGTQYTVNLIRKPV
ncbi:InlB B-repeat-containing protein [Emergencia timonensis]|uniref:InlB B-repeat-containing protein n=1 Tax=Emergencia timonensis TaxID=1776384 RepID=UPI0039937B7A